MENKLCFMGSTVVSGAGQGIVTAIGSDTKFGQIVETVSSVRPETEFQKGLKSFGVLLVRVIFVMTSFIFLINGVFGRSWLESAMFALSVAIGLTPELLPVVVTVSLAHGAKRLAKKDIIVKQLVAIEDLGNMEVLCCDKTGTLTRNEMTVQPIETSEGWLLIYHGVLTTCNGFTYSAGAALLDIDRPWNVLHRTDSYIMSPQTILECAGDVPNVVFPVATLCDAPTGRIAIYYGAADTVTCLAFTQVDELIDFIKRR